MSDRLKELREKALSLPLTPGVYIMKDGDGKIIYIGKSRSLKNRVTQYFREAGHTNVKTAQMVSRVRDFEYILTDTENEALLLENRLIKAHEPKYNIKLKDGKRDPYLKVTVTEDFPRIEYCHQIEQTVQHFGCDYAIYEADFIYRNACAMCIMQIGELAGKLSPEITGKYTNIPWRGIKATRNIFAHAYGDVDLKVAWETIQNDGSTPVLVDKAVRTGT